MQGNGLHRRHGRWVDYAFARPNTRYLTASSSRHVSLPVRFPRLHQNFFLTLGADGLVICLALLVYAE